MTKTPFLVISVLSVVFLIIGMVLLLLGHVGAIALAFVVVGSVVAIVAGTMRLRSLKAE